MRKKILSSFKPSCYNKKEIPFIYLFTEQNERLARRAKSRLNIPVIVKPVMKK
jgi:hypothetical protein